MKLLIMLLMAVLSGCASFRSYEQPIVKPELISINSSKKLLVFMTWKAVPDRFYSSSEMLNIENKQSALFYEELKSTGCCEIANAGQEPDLILNGEIDVSYKADSHLAAIARIPSQVSFAIIPAWDNFHFKVSIQARNSKGFNREYSATDSGLLIQWLPMAPLFIFGNDMIKINQDIIRNIHRNLIYRMKKDGILVK